MLEFATATPAFTGWDYAMAAAQAALAAGAVSCDVALPPQDWPEGWDAADAIGAGFDVPQFVAHGPRMSIKPAQGLPSQEASVWATDDALALAFTSRYGEDWRYCSAGASGWCGPGNAGRPTRPCWSIT